MAIVDPNYKLICVDVSGYERNSDWGIFEKSIMRQLIESGKLNVSKNNG